MARKKNKKLTLPEIVFNEIMNAVTKGNIKSVKDIRKLLSENKDVQALGVTRPEITFEIFKVIFSDNPFHLVTNDDDEDFITRV